MTRKISLSAIVIAVATVVTLAVAFVTPAGAHHKDGHERGKPSNSSETTEDNDDDGHPNSPDPEGDADNKHPSGKDKHDEAGGSGNQGSAQSDPDDDGRGPDRSNGGADQPGGSGGEDKLDQDGNNGCGNDDDFEDDNEGLCLGRQGPKDQVAAAQMTIEVDCFSVTVSSSKDISFVEVTFADGTTVKFEGLHDTEFSRTFEAPLESARAKSGTTIVSDAVDEECDVSGDVIEQPCDADETMPGIQPCDEDVEGGVIVRPGVPSRPPGDVVLGGRITRQGAPEVAAEVQAQPEGEGALPFTGAGLGGIALAGLALMTAGGGLLRIRRG